jgi:nucleoside-diphosphate-sugar epimerase
VARVLVVGCGCRGLELARALAADGHAVRGTTRRPERLGEIEAAGAQAALADPDRLATMLPHIDGVAVMCWLMGTASGDREAIAALHGPRLDSMVETLVDTHVRGLVYEAAGTVDSALLEQGAARVRMAGARFHMPAEVADVDPARHHDWLEAMRAAVARVLAA